MELMMHSHLVHQGTHVTVKLTASPLELGEEEVLNGTMCSEWCLAGKFLLTSQDPAQTCLLWKS
jgi:hypothetical protein